MKSYTDRLAKLGSELDSVAAKISEYENRRDAIMAEIQSVVSGSAAKTGGAGSGIPRPGARRSGPRVRTMLADKIKPILDETPGLSTADIATRLRTTNSKVGVSLTHMANRNEVRREGNSWFPLPTQVTQTTDTTQTNV